MRNIALALALFLSFCIKLFAQEGSLDSTFNSIGYTTTSGYYGSMVVEAIQPDGKIVVAGKNSSNERVVLRYNTNGSLDATFNGTGIAKINRGNGFGNAVSVLIQSDGKIVVVGSSYNSSYKNIISLVRLNSDGTIDNTFGSSGVVTTNIGAYEDRAGRAAIQSDDKIIVGAYSLTSWTGDYSYTILRYTTTGALDATFNGTGYKNIYLGCSNFGNYNMLPSCGIALQSNNKILFAGSYGTSQATRDLICLRLNSNGSLDSTFNSVAYKTIDLSGDEDYANDVTVDNNGKILLGGKAGSYSAVVRLNSNGVTDSTFGANGISYFDLGNSYYSCISQINVLPNNKILVGGMAYIGSYNIAIARLNSNGYLDTSFGNNGKFNFGFLGSNQADRYGHAVQNDGKIVVCCGYNQSVFVVARLKQKGFPIVTAYPTASSITYGQSLSSSTLSGGSVSVPGVWSFTNPSLIPSAGNYLASITFTPTDPNYSTANGTTLVNVNTKELSVINAIAANKQYDGTTAATISGASLQGIVGTDNVTLNNATAGSFAQSSIGTNISVTTSMTLAGADISNYTLIQPTNISADITEREIYIGGSFTVSDKPYDGNTNANMVSNNLTLIDTIFGDDVMFSDIEVEFVSQNPGTNIEVVITYADLEGNDAQNYSISLENSPTTHANIYESEGINDYSQNSFYLWPNPASSCISIFYNEPIYNVSIINSKGQLVKSITAGNKNTIDLEALEPGIYFIKIFTKKGDTIIDKFIKE